MTLTDVSENDEAEGAVEAAPERSTSSYFFEALGGFVSFFVVLSVAAALLVGAGATVAHLWDIPGKDDLKQIVASGRTVEFRPRSRLWCEHGEFRADFNDTDLIVPVPSMVEAMNKICADHAWDLK
jgi:hypothetical protein